jgi:hypothetical protein
LRGQAAGTTAVQTALSTGESIVGTAISAGQVVSDLLIDLKSKVTAASQEGLDSASRQALSNEFDAIRDQLESVVSTAVFNGTNLIESGAQDLKSYLINPGQQFQSLHRISVRRDWGLTGYLLAPSRERSAHARQLIRPLSRRLPVLLISGHRLKDWKVRMTLPRALAIFRIRD